MRVHLFGAVSSPGCPNFGLKRAADDGEKEYGEQAAEFIRRDFYVDDGLTSVLTADQAITLVKASQGICAKAGLRLHKISSNKRDVLEVIPSEHRAKGLKELDLKNDPLPLERALGVVWCIETDSFQFRIELRDLPFTRRGVLATVSSIYDPSGFVAPVTLKGKQVLHQMCQDKLDWDSPVPESLRSQWEKWLRDVLTLDQLQIQRCFKPENFGRVKACELHLQPASIPTYKRAWALFNQFLYDVFQSTMFSLPIPPPTLALFIAYLFDKHYAPSSVNTFVSALGYSHKLAGFSDPGKVFYIVQTLKGYRKIGHRLDCRLPITLNILHRILDSASHITGSQYRITLFRAMCSLAFFAFLRVGEITATRASAPP